MSTLRSFYDALRGPYRTERELPIKAGETVVRFQALAKQTSTQKLVAFTSGGSDGANILYAFALEDVTATADTYSDYLMQADSFNGTKAVFANAPTDTWQNKAQVARVLKINMEAWNPAENVPLESPFDLESESEA